MSGQCRNCGYDGCVCDQPKRRSVSKNTKQIIRDEIKIIQARIKDKRATCQKLVGLCANLHNELSSLEAIEHGLKRDLIRRDTQ